MKDICKTVLEHPIATCMVVSALAGFIKTVADLAKKTDKTAQ